MNTDDAYELFRNLLRQRGLVRKCGKERLDHEWSVCLWLIEHDRDAEPEAVVYQTVRDLEDEFKGGPYPTTTDLGIDFDSMVAPEADF